MTAHKGTGGTHSQRRLQWLLASNYILIQQTTQSHSGRADQKWTHPKAVGWKESTHAPHHTAAATLIIPPPKLMSWIVTVIWIRLCILTRIHKAHPLLWFYEELKHCRKLNTVCLSDWIRAQHRSSRAKKSRLNCSCSVSIFLFSLRLKQASNLERQMQL